MDLGWNGVACMLQIQKIHNIIGTPPPEFLAKLKRHSSHIDFNFPAKDGNALSTGLS